MIVFIGGCNLDIIARSNHNFCMKDSNIGKISYSHGGVMRNICHNVSLMLPKQTAMLTAVGDDHFGKEIISELQDICDTTRVLQVENAATSVFNAILDDKNDMVCAVNDMQVLQNVNANYLNKNQDLLKKCDTILIDTNLSRETIEYIFENYASKKICCDAVSLAKVHRLDGFYDKLTIFKVNELELKGIIGDYQNNEEMLKKARSLNCKYLYITLGSKGAYLVTEKEHFYYSETFENIESTIGLGDAFISGSIVCLEKNITGLEALKFCTKVSYLTSKVLEANNLALSYEKVIEEMQ